MRKLLIVVAIVFTAQFLFLILFMVALGTGGFSAAAPIGPVALEEKAEEYAVVASKMAAPWEIVILADAIEAWDGKEFQIEDKNPMYTTLEFLILKVTTEKKTSNGWVYSGMKTYTAKDEILKFLGLSEDDISEHTPETLGELAAEKCREKSSDNKKYTAEFAANSDFETVLKKYIKMDKKEIEQVLELHDVHYMEINLEPEALGRIREIQSDYGMYQVNEYEAETGDYASYEGFTFPDGETEVVYYSQLDDRWKDELYGTDKIGDAACGPTSMAIVISSLTDETVDPVFMANWSVEHGYWAPGNGSYHALIPKAAEAYGLNVTGRTSENAQDVLDALADGKLVVALMVRGSFAKYGHFIVLRGVSDGKILVADPSSMKNSEKLWDTQYVFDNGSLNAVATGGPFWIIG